MITLKNFVSLALALILYSPLASAYFIAVPKDQGAIRYDQPTRLLISGRGTDLGLQPQIAAIGAGMLYRRNYPTEQVVMMSVFENDRNEAALRRAGWILMQNNKLHFETKVALQEIRKFTRIRALEFYGHNSASLGVQLDGRGYRFDFRDPEMSTLTPLFDRGAFVFIHGCNGGWIIAQELSKVWNVPVAGSFTETQFERLHSDGHYYIADKTKAPDSDWAVRNTDLNMSCAIGGCLRMRPDYTRYIGVWGDMRGPLLSHYKFFCQLDVKECEKRMASSLYGFLAEKSLNPRSTYQEFRQVAKEYLCPLYKDRVITRDCLHQLDLVEQGRGNVNVSYVVRDQQLTCNLRECTGKMVCDDHSCKIFDRSSADSRTMTDEYMHLLRGFRALKSEGI